MRSVWVLIGLILACLPTSLRAQSKAKTSSETIIFTNINVVDTREGSILPHRVVEINGDRIVAVGKIGLLDSARNIHVVNASGLYLIPALWDMNVHTANRSSLWDEQVLYPLYVANGVMGVRDMGGDTGLLESRQQRIEAGELLGPEIIPAGSMLSDPPREAVTKLKARGLNLLAVPPDISRDTYFLLAAESANQRMQLVGPVPNSISVEEASAAGQRSIEQLTGISLACSSQENELRRRALEALTKQDFAASAGLAARAWATYDPQKAWNLFLKLADTNTWQVPALAWSRAEGQEAPDLTPGLEYVPVSIRHQWTMPASQPKTAPELEFMRQQAGRDVELVNTMHRAGVQFLAGTHSPDRYISPGFSLHAELEWLVKAGLTPAQALQSATIDPAIFLVKLDKFGVVEAGHAADLILLEANPLDDIRNTRRIAGIVRAGRFYSRADLDRLLVQIKERASRE